MLPQRRIFAAQLADALENAGYQCELCEIPEDGIAGEMREQAVPAKDTAGEISPQTAAVLERYIGKEYAAVIDFNSKLPRLMCDDDTYYLDTIQAPFLTTFWTIRCITMQHCNVRYSGIMSC